MKAKVTAAQLDLLQALRSETPTCLGSHLPMSDDFEDRADAVRLACPNRPLMVECHAAGASEKYGVWGGVDRTTTTTTNPKEAPR